MYLRSHYPASGRFKSIYMVPRNVARPIDDEYDSDESSSDTSMIASLPPTPATDSEDNSDSMAFHRGHISSAAGGSSSASPGGKSGRPCQYNFLVNLGKLYLT